MPADQGAEPAATDITAAWDDGAIILSGKALPGLLAVVPVDALALGESLVPTAGSWERGNHAARFTPRFAPMAGTTSVVLGRQEPHGAWGELVRVSTPVVRRAPSTVITTIEPGCEEIPANLLRFVVTFSAAMEEGSAAGRIHLRDQCGTDLPGALFEMPPELWDRRRRRLTVLLEPGRIKRGLQPNVQAGPPLREGMTVTVVIDPNIRDAAGVSLVAGTQSTYRVGAPVRTRIDPACWNIHWPETGNDPLIVRFDRPLDRALVRRYLRLLDNHGRPVPGRASSDTRSTEWMFTPEGSADNTSEWRLHIDTRLEDLAGNSVRRVFDRDLSEPADDGTDMAVIVISPDAVAP